MTLLTLLIYSAKSRIKKITSTANGISSDEEIGQEKEIALRIKKRGDKIGVKRESLVFRL